MKKMNNKGFGLAEGLLILLVVIVVGALGWYGYSRMQDNKRTTEPAATTVKEEIATNTNKLETTNAISTKEAVTAEPPSDCPKVEQQGVAVFITLSTSGADRKCIQLSKNEVVSISNSTNKTVTVKLGDRTRTAESNSSTGFDGEVGGFLQVGENKMVVSGYKPTQYPIIWVY